MSIVAAASGSIKRYGWLRVNRPLGVGYELSGGRTSSLGGLRLARLDDGGEQLEVIEQEPRQQVILAN